MGKTKVAVLGSTGSIGTQTLDVIDRYKEHFEVVLLSARCSSQKLLGQVKKFRPQYVVTEDVPTEKWLKELPKGTKHFSGKIGLTYAIIQCGAEKFVNAIAGIYGIEPSYTVLKETNAQLLLANKETVIATGEYLKPYLNRIIPVDSEHNAVFQLMQNLKREKVERVILTASGGPFRNYSKQKLEQVKPQEALKHPRWNMGKKITVDSATLMNKGFEVIEAKYLFDIDIGRIEVVIHPESLIHGIVETTDGNLFALISPTDMRFPIQHALFYPKRAEKPIRRLDLTNVGALHFEKPDIERFECLKLAYEYGRKGLPYTALLVGADEAAVELFLKGKIKFTEIPKLIREKVEKLATQYGKKLEFEDVPQMVRRAYEETLNGFETIL